MQLQIKPQEYGIEEKKAKELTNGLDVIISERKELEKSYKSVIALDITEENIPEFRALRIKVRDNRTKGINVWHKTNKEFFLAGGRFVDAIKNKEIAINEAMEEKLMAAEKHFENLEKERKEKLNQDRKAKVLPYFPDAEYVSFGDMDEDVFNAYFETKKKQHQERIQAEKKAEAERLENERLDKLERDRRFKLAPYSQFITSDSDLRLMSDKDYKYLLNSLISAKREYESEQEKIRLENERLKKEREAAEQKRLAEEKKRKTEEAKKQAEYEANLKKEREAREKLEREEKARKDAEKAEADRKAKEEEEKRKEAEKLAKAPIKEKLYLWVDSFELPETSVNNEVSKEIQAKFQAFKNWSINQIKNL